MTDKITCNKCDKVIHGKLFMIGKNFYHDGCYRIEVEILERQGLEIKCSCGKIFSMFAEFEEHWKTHTVKTKEEKMDEIHEDTQGLIKKDLLLD